MKHTPNRIKEIFGEYIILSNTPIMGIRLSDRMDECAKEIDRWNKNNNLI
jgi:hypothetical protein